MKTFKRVKSLEEIRAQCQAQGLAFDDTAFRGEESDFVRIAGGGASVLFSTVNGRFFGTTPDGVEFSSASSAFDGAPWFQALLAFFYEAG